MKSIFTLATAALVLLACQSTGKNVVADNNEESVPVSAIQPIKNVENNAKTFIVDAGSADTILLENGGSIVFDANAFVDAEGKPVNGKVDVHWEEFHSLEDIMLSGIPMKYDSSGTAYDLSSGGMFTIKASQKDKELKMAEGKKAQVNLVSLQDTPCYNFYELDEESGDWSYETTKNGEVVELPQESTQAAEVETEILQIDLMTDHIDELSDKDIVGWQAMSPISEADKKLLGYNYTKSKIVPSGVDGEYEATIVVKKKHLNFKVKPYFMSDAVADSRSNSAELNAETAALLKYAADVASGKVIRSIEIDDFGTYNWDVVNYRENSQRMIAKFNFPDKVDSRMVALYLISPDENIIVKYDAGGDKKFSFDPDKRNCIVAILPDNKLVSFSDKDFDRVRASQRGTTFEFALKDSGIKLKSSKDISNHLDELI